MKCSRCGRWLNFILLIWFCLCCLITLLLIESALFDTKNNWPIIKDILLFRHLTYNKFQNDTEFKQWLSAQEAKEHVPKSYYISTPKDWEKFWDQKERLFPGDTLYIRSTMMIMYENGELHIQNDGPTKNSNAN